MIMITLNSFKMEDRLKLEDGCGVEVEFSLMPGSRHLMIMIKNPGEHEVPIIAELTVRQRIDLHEWL